MIDKYMWQLFSRLHLVPQVRALEIWSISHGRYERDERGCSIPSYPAVKLTAELLKRSPLVRGLLNARRINNDKAGAEAIGNDVVASLFCSLVCVLPNLQELRIGNAWLMDFPIFVCLLSSDTSQQLRLPRAWQNGFSKTACAVLSSQITVLDIPAEMTAMMFFRAQNLFDFRSLSKLRELGLSMKALQFRPYRQTVQDPREIFPVTLEVLRISEASSDVTGHLRNLCIAKKGGHFPALRRVEVYFMEHLEESETFVLPPGLLVDIRAMFKDAKVAILVYFPPWALRTWDAGGTPWSLRIQGGALEEGELRTLYTDQVVQPETFKGSPGVEAEWDGDGDTVMKGCRDGIV
ncbi:hypothetical protein T440DRAFT_222033 [Plenodomus tracheiphilus IPT5]|uniref:Uncharacterized protein n=1 Tax=Plenodomus tracheiphilus IPT5 TaxID=1408161 RepID=A0A6A7AX45_9PLEO|nr:hypothetical protein T440DRAFT_222033 [Plenodomus tracheiphilus IPT5]